MSTKTDSLSHCDCIALTSRLLRCPNFVNFIFILWNDIQTGNHIQKDKRKTYTCTAISAFHPDGGRFKKGSQMICCPTVTTRKLIQKCLTAKLHQNSKLKRNIVYSIVFCSY